MSRNDAPLIIDMRLHPSLGEGVYAHIFGVGDKAFKLFLAYPTPHSEEKRRSTFQSQCEAYSRAASDASLRSHVPIFFGPHPIGDVIDKEGKSIKQNYMTDCCYVLEALDGPHEKVLAVRDQFDHLIEAYRIFSQKGFDLHDGDVFNY